MIGSGLLHRALNLLHGNLAFNTGTLYRCLTQSFESGFAQHAQALSTVIAHSPVFITQRFAQQWNAACRMLRTERLNDFRPHFRVSILHQLQNRLILKCRTCAQIQLHRFRPYILMLCTDQPVECRHDLRYCLSPHGDKSNLHKIWIAVFQQLNQKSARIQTGLKQNVRSQMMNRLPFGQ
ncbi:hypothetical protein D3C76_1311520 [compost metagenome]